MLYDKRWDKQLVKTVEPSPGRLALLDAADYIEAHGWCQTFRSLGKVCPVEALNRLYGEDSPIKDAAKRLFFDRHGETLMYWNDQYGRTKEQVIAALRATAFDD